MGKKFSKYIRLFHRYMTVPFVIITIYVMLINPGNPVMLKVQKVAMLTLAVTGTILFLQIYQRKYFGKKKK